MIFKELPIGERFKFFGKVYTKIAKSMAQDKNRNGMIFGCDIDGRDGLDEVELLPEQPEVENPS